MTQNPLQVIVMTSDVSQDLVLPGFLYLFRRYWGEEQPVDIVGFTPVQWELPAQAKFHSLGAFGDYPASKWSNALMRTIDTIAEPYFLLLLDDYYIVRQVDTHALEILHGYIRQFTYTLKIDVTRDRLYADTGRYLFDFNTYANLEYLDLILSPPGSNYQMSLWGGLWNRDLMKQFLVEGETAQQIELNGTPRVNQRGSNVVVMGTRQAPLLHGNILQSNKPRPIYRDGGWAINESDLSEMRKLGLLEKLEHE